MKRGIDAAAPPCTSASVRSHQRAILNPLQGRRKHISSRVRSFFHRGYFCDPPASFGRLVRSGAQPSELFALLLFAVPSVFTMQKLLEFDALTERSHALTAHSALLHGTVSDVHLRKASQLISVSCRC